MSCLLYDNVLIYNLSVTIIPDAPGILLNGLCVICFAQILWYKHESTVNNEANMFKFLFVKAVCDFLMFTNDIFILMYIFCTFNNTFCHLHATPAFSYWAIYFYYAMEAILIIISSLMEVAATLGIYTKV
jgi:hypothetical protein